MEPGTIDDEAAFRPEERFVPVLVVLACAAAGLYAIHPVANPDFGWHVALGRWVLAHGRVPDADPFSHTAAGAPMVAHAWVSQVLYAAGIDAFGVRGLRFANGALAAGLLALLYYWLRRARARPALALFLMVLWATVAESRFQLRPHMFNLLFFMAAYGALFVGRPRLSRTQLAAFFFALVLWMNLHSGAVLFAGLVALYAATATFERLALGRPPQPAEPGEGRLGRLWTLAALSGAAILVTPNHVRILGYVLETRRVNAGLSLEWFSLASRRGIESHDALELLCFSALLAATLVLAWVRRREVPLSRLVIVLFVAALPFAAQRFTWACFVPALFVAEGLAARGLSRRAAAAGGWTLAANAACLLQAALLAAAAFGPSLAPERVGRRMTQAANFATGMFPTSAMTFLDEAKLSGRLFNPNKWGGYILFRTQGRIPVFVDGRWITLGEQVVRDARTISLRAPGFLEQLDRYGIGIVLVDRGWMTEELRGSPHWRTVFENFNSGVYLRDVRRDARTFDENLARSAAYYGARGIPFDADLGFREHAVFEESPRFAQRMNIRRVHMERFGDLGPAVLTRAPRWVAGWPE